MRSSESCSSIGSMARQSTHTRARLSCLCPYRITHLLPPHPPSSSTWRCPQPYCQHAHPRPSQHPRSLSVLCASQTVSTPGHCTDHFSFYIPEVTLHPSLPMGHAHIYPSTGHTHCSDLHKNDSYTKTMSILIHFLHPFETRLRFSSSPFSYLLYKL